MHRFLERAVEGGERLLITTLAARYLVKLILHRCSERVANIFRKILFEPARDDHASRSRFQGAPIFVDITAVLNGLHDGCIGRRAPDTALLEFADEARFRIA